MLPLCGSIQMIGFQGLFNGLSVNIDINDV